MNLHLKETLDCTKMIMYLREIAPIDEEMIVQKFFHKRGVYVSSFLSILQIWKKLKRSMNEESLLVLRQILL